MKPHPNNTKPPKRESHLKWFLRGTSRMMGYAQKIPGVGIRPQIYKDQIIELMQTGSYDPTPASVRVRDGQWERRKYIPAPSKRLYEYHQAGDVTLYYQGNGNPNDDTTIVGIDIDVQKAQGLGSTPGAIAFAEHLKATVFPNLVFEASTNGHGVHGYIVLHKAGFPAKEVRDGLKRLEKWLRQEAKRVQADIELVEVKGAPPCINAWENSKPSDITGGTWFKFARTDIRSTTRLSMEDLADLKLDNEPESPKRQKKISTSTCKQSGGSWVPRFVTPFDLAELPRLQELAIRLNLPCRCCGDVAVTDEDAAIFLLLLKLFTKKMNANGAMPTARFQAVWEKLYEAGEISRAWNHKRYAAIRNRLSARSVDGADLLTWQDYTYCLGQACKWHASAELLRLMTLPDMEASIEMLLSSSSSLKVSHDYLRPCWVTRLGLLIEPSNNDGQAGEITLVSKRAKLEQRSTEPDMASVA